MAVGGAALLADVVEGAPLAEEEEEEDALAQPSFAPFLSFGFFDFMFAALTEAVARRRCSTRALLKAAYLPTLLVDLSWRSLPTEKFSIKLSIDLGLK